MVSQNYVLDGTPHGDLANEFADADYNSGLFRPYRDHSGNRCVTINVGKQYDSKQGKEITQYEKMTFNEARNRGYESPTLYLGNSTILRKNEWIQLDLAVLKAYRLRLRAWADLTAANTFTLDGMSKEILEHETMNDPGEAIVDMEGISEGRTDTPLFQLEGLPLPITHSDFWYSKRKLRISRNTGASLSTLMGEAAGRRVAETIEKTTIGVTTGLTYGTTANYGRTPSVYGYVNHPARNLASLTTPTGSNSATTLSEILAMRTTLYDDGVFGPFVLYNGTDWDRYLDDDHIKIVTSGGAAPSTTLRRRLETIEDIQAVRRLDYLSPSLTGGTFDMIMVALSNPTVARAVIGMPLQTIQWPTQGGMKVHFKVMTISAPQIRADFSGASGINHASVT